jgi:hypothetical protein
VGFQHAGEGGGAALGNWALRGPIDGETTTALFEHFDRTAFDLAPPDA